MMSFCPRDFVQMATDKPFNYHPGSEKHSAVRKKCSRSNVLRNFHPVTFKLHLFPLSEPYNALSWWTKSKLSHSHCQFPHSLLGASETTSPHLATKYYDNNNDNHEEEEPFAFHDSSFHTEAWEKLAKKLHVRWWPRSKKRVWTRSSSMLFTILDKDDREPWAIIAIFVNCKTRCGLCNRN